MSDPNAQPSAGEILAAEVAKHQVREADIARAQSVVLPGPLREAFAGDPVHLHGFTLQPVTARLAAALERIDSPLLAIIRLAAEFSKESAIELATRAEAKIKLDPAATIETVFLFINPVRESWKLLDAGREIFRSRALEIVGEALHPLQLADLERACAEHYAKSFATIVNYSAAKNPGDGSFPSPPAMATASAGGSTS